MVPLELALLLSDAGGVARLCRCRFCRSRVARYVFVGVSSALLAYGATRRAWFPLMLFASGAYVNATLVAQWSPLFTAAILLPGLAVLFPAKPTLGAICAASMTTSRRTAIAVSLGWIVLAVLSWIALPQWFASWRVAIRGAAHVRPLIALPGGFLLLAAALKWRRPEARLLVAYALVPQTTMLYEALPALLVPETWPQMLMLTIGSIVAYLIESTRDPCDRSSDADRARGDGDHLVCLSPGACLGAASPE